MTAAELIKTAKAWDYSKVTDEEMFAWMKQAENIGFMEMLVQAPVMLVRARCELDYEEHDISREPHVSFLRDESRASLQRCSQQGESAFYAVLVETVEEEPQAIAVAISESSKILSKREATDAQEDAVVSFWEVRKPFHAAFLAHHLGFQKAHPMIARVREKFAEGLRDEPNGQDMIALAEFLSDEFAQSVEPGEEYRYRFSSYVASTMLKNGYDAIIYPAVKPYGIVLNIVIRKDLADPQLENNKLELVDVEIHKDYKYYSKAEYTLYKRNANSDMSGVFDFQQVDGFEMEYNELKERVRHSHSAGIIYVVPKSAD
jgi:hypothetical protein